MHPRSHKNFILSLLFAFSVSFLGICYASTTDVIQVEAVTNILAREGIFISDISLASGSGGTVENKGISGTFTNNTITLDSSASDTTTVNYTVRNNSGSTVYFRDVVYMMQEEIESLGLSGYVYYDNPNIIIDKSNFSSMVGEALPHGSSMTIPVVYKYATSDVSNNTLNISLSFNFVTNCWTIDFDDNITLDPGETLSNFPTTQLYWGDEPFAFPSASASNHIFLGWSENSDATEPEYLAGDTISDISEDTTYYAVWTQYKIIYNDNYGTMGPGEVNYGINKNVNISNISPIRDYFAFDGWATDLSSPAVYQPNDSYVFNDDVYSVTLYAKWTPIGVYSVTVDGLPYTPSADELIAYEDEPYSIDVRNSNFYSIIYMGGERYYGFTYSGNIITIPNVTGNIAITLTSIADVDYVVDDANPDFVVADVSPSNPIPNTTSLVSYKFENKVFSEKNIKQIDVQIIYTNGTGSTVTHPFTLTYNNQSLTQNATFRGKTTNGTATVSFVISSPALSFNDSFTITNATGSGTGNVQVSGLSFHITFVE